MVSPRTAPRLRPRFPPASKPKPRIHPRSENEGGYTRPPSHPQSRDGPLIVGIVLAASRGIVYRGAWILGGIAAGVGGAMLIAAGAGTIASAASGMGQEMLNAAILLAAVVMLGWHNIWMT